MYIIFVCKPNVKSLKESILVYILLCDGKTFVKMTLTSM